MSMFDLCAVQALARAVRPSLALLAVMVVISAFLVVWVSHLNRQAFDALQRELTHTSTIQEQWGQLLLQYSTLATYSRVDTIARKELHMITPDTDSVVVSQTASSQ